MRKGVGQFGGLMLALPQRRQFATRDDFAAAVSASFEELFARYEAETVTHSNPDWAVGSDCFNVSLPIAIASEGGAAYGVSSIIKHAIEMKKSAIGRLARVERGGQWIVFFEAK
jgi:hypothetical protein